MTAARIRAFDWLRGIAVLVMIQTHSLVLLWPGLRQGRFFEWLQRIDGLVAPAFIFSAGFSLALVQVRGAASGARAARVRKTLRRLGEVLAVATLVNWMWFPLLREPHYILRFDILHCIGLGLLIALPIFALLSPWPRVLRWVAFALGAAVFGLAPLAEHVRGPLAALCNDSSGTVFPLVPWAGYVYLGASAGATAALGDARELARWVAALMLLGLLLWLQTDALAHAYPPHEFWKTNPANHAQRWTQVCGIVLLLLAAEQLWPARNAVVKLVEVFGTSSLAAYFWHLNLLYFRYAGFSFEAAWGQRSSWARYWLLLALLIAGTCALTWLTDLAYQLSPLGKARAAPLSPRPPPASARPA